MLTSTHTDLAVRRSACARRKGTARRSGHGTARLPDGRTTTSLLNGARDLMEVALPFTAPPNGCKETIEEFGSIAIAERVARLQAVHKFPLPAGLSLVFPFIK